MEPKSQVLWSGGITNSYTWNQQFRVLGYAKTLITIRNMGGGSGITYRVKANPKTDDALAPWVTLLSGTTTVSGDVYTHKVTDPWDAIRVEAKHTQTDRSAMIWVVVNGDPR